MANEVVIIDKAEIEQFRTDGSAYVEQARGMAKSIHDPATLGAAAKFMLAAKERAKRIVERFKGPKADARKAWQNWCDLESELIEPYERIEKEILKPAMARYQEAEDRRIREEEARRRREAEKEEEERRLKEAQELAENGQKELADAVLDAPVVVAPVVLPRAEAPEGISYRDVWRFEIVDANKIPRDYLMVDDKKIGAVVRAMKGETRIDGVRVYSEKVVAGRV